MYKNDNEVLKNLYLQKVGEEYNQTEEMDARERDNLEYTIPEGWDADFRAAIDEAFEKIEREEKKERREKIKVLRKSVIAAGLVFAILYFSPFGAQEVQGNKILEVFKSVIETDNERFVMFGTGDMSEKEIIDDSHIFFQGDTVMELYGNIRQERKRPIFQLLDMPTEYEIATAKYSEEFQIINVQIETNEGRIYISQGEQLEDGGAGRTTEPQIYSTVKNNDLELEIEIYEGQVEDGYGFSINVGKDILHVQAMTTLELCEWLAENFIYE